MLGATFAMGAYNLTDTWFVSRLGTNSLAAMSFSFPVIMLLRFTMRGLGIGAMTSVAHAMGKKKHQMAAALTTHAIFLGLILACIISAAGLLTGVGGGFVVITAHDLQK